MRLVMTLAVRDEAELLGVNLRFHRALGVDAFVVLDNGSTDRTAEVLARWGQSGLARVITDSGPSSYDLLNKCPTLLARVAASELDADWVLNSTADEFWRPLAGSLKSVFTELGPDVHAVIAPRHTFVPRPDGSEPFWERMTLRGTRAHGSAKFAHRATSDIEVGPGSSYVCSPSLGIRETGGGGSHHELATLPPQPPLISPGPEFPFAVLHFPMRSFDQFRESLAIGPGFAPAERTNGSEARREEELGLEIAAQRWGELVGDARTGKRMADGELVEDTGLRDLIRAIGPPDEGPLDPPPIAVPARTAEKLRVGEAEVMREALRGLTHSQAERLRKLRQMQDRLRTVRQRSRRFERRTAKLARRARQLSRRLRAIETSRWWRLRPRLPGRTSTAATNDEHWSALAKVWSLSGPPLRVSAEDVQLYREAVSSWRDGRGPPRVLLLGVTPELYRMRWPTGTDFVAADREQAMIDSVWPGPRDRVIREDWTALSLPDASRDLVLCDGGLHLVDYPSGQARLVRSLARVIDDGGLCALRLFVPPARAEDPAAVLEDLLGGRISSVNALKLRLAMALQPDPRTGVSLARVWETFNRAVPDPEAAERAVGWPLEEIRSIDAYRNSPSSYHFIGVDEVTRLFCEEPGGFAVESLRVPDYELGERCPVLVLRREAA